MFQFSSAQVSFNGVDTCLTVDFFLETLLIIPSLPDNALAVASKNLDTNHRPDFSNTEPAADIGPFPQWLG
jgi:hypothetical protein